MRATATDEQLRVVLVDAREERRALMTGVVEGDGPRAVVVGVADGPEPAVAAVRDQEADAVLLDVWMPRATGLRAVRDLRRAFPALAVVVCSFDLDGATIGQALAAGADACLRKPASPHEVVDALARAVRGRAPDLARAAVA